MGGRDAAGDSANGVTTVLIASPIEAEQAQRLITFDPERVRVIHDPQLLPTPRYPADHDGVKPNLSELEIGRWRSHLARADVLFDFDWLDPANIPLNAPRVRWVQATSSGIGRFLDRHGLLSSGITFTTAAGVHAVPLAEFVALGMLYFAKGVPELLSRQAERRWERHTTGQLAGQRALVIGLGGVGSEIARKVAALGVEVHGMARTIRSVTPPGIVSQVERGQLRAFLPSADYVVLACPHTSETHHLIGAPELAAMKSSAVLINVARGAVVEETALISALEQGRIGGAFLDVFEREPLPSASPLWGMANVFVSPHSASTVAVENKRIVDLFLDNLARFLDGRELLNRYDHDRAY